MGHEGSGVVLQIGPDVKKVNVGDHVVLSWLKGSGLEASSTLYESAKGTINSGAVSTFLTKSVVSENRVTPISKEMPLKEAALLGCAVPTGAGMVLNTAKVRPGSTLAIFGTGGIGLAAILVASSICSKVIAIDINETKLNLAKRLGATHTVNAKDQAVAQVIRQYTDNRGVDYAIESAGLKETMEAAFESIRPAGGLCILAGNLPHGQRIKLDPYDLIKGKRIIGTWGGESTPDKDIPQYVQRYLDKNLPLELLITHEYTLPDINRALFDLTRGQVGRAVINVSRIEPGN
jgi:S-(hydroxymethyl)glutathione dehydrogenase/alcohol dehydrogenase